MTLSELALAYELRQEGCCWKRIAQGLGGDPLLISAQIYHLVSHGIHKGLDGYERQPGRAPNFNLEIIIKADDMRRRGSTWEGVGRELDSDCEKLRKAHRYALNKGLIPERKNEFQF
jgi:hypothetical protein